MMTLQQLRGILNDYQVVEADETNQAVVLYNARTMRYYRLALPEVRQADESEVRDVLEGKREPEELDLFLRVVGYYAFRSNMNKSKWAEIEDREHGNYFI